VKIVQVNLAYDAGVTDPATLLDRYHTLTDLAAALSAAGAEVSVVQRFSRTATLARDQVDYHFVPDAGPAFPAPSSTAPDLVNAVVATQPDVVHVNGLMFPAMVAALRAALPGARIVVQDHAGIRAPGVIDRMLDNSWRGLAEADAYSFTAAAYADRWREAGLLNRAAPVFEIVEAGTRLVPIPRHEARAHTELTGNPLLLWVGRLNKNKDPITVLRGVDRAFVEIEDAQLCMVYSEATLEAEVRDFIDRSPRLQERVTLTWRVPYDAMPLYYSSADCFVSGSHQEGSGYALIEAMACGVIPVVSDIPSFRVIAGDCGVRWTAGDAESLADALVGASRFDRAVESARVRERFVRELSWDAIAAKTLAAYRTLVG
jgi:glycosyltransferase involved in cell wall biosynthesis